MGNDSYVCLYVDNSNIFHEGQRFAADVKGEPRTDFRLFQEFCEVGCLWPQGR